MTFPVTAYRHFSEKIGHTHNEAEWEHVRRLAEFTLEVRLRTAPLVVSSQHSFHARLGKYAASPKSVSCMLLTVVPCSPCAQSAITLLGLVSVAH